MKSFRILFWTASLLSLLLLTPSSQAATKLSKISAEVRGVKTSGSVQLLLGSRYLHHLSSLFSIGGAAYTGQLSEGDTGSFSYGGLMAAYTGWLSRNLGLDMSLLVGGGGGFSTTNGVGGGMVLEPTLSLSFRLGDTVRVSLGGGYLYLPNSSNFSGVTAGVRFDFLSGLFQRPRPAPPRPAPPRRRPEPKPPEKEAASPPTGLH